MRGMPGAYMSYESSRKSHEETFCGYDAMLSSLQRYEGSGSLCFVTAPGGTKSLVWSRRKSYRSATPSRGGRNGSTDRRGDGFFPL
jgi:hypothetical protein